MVNNFAKYTDAVEWHSNLNAEQLNYFQSVEKYIAKMIPGYIVTIDKIVKPKNLELFWKSLNYILLGSNIEISFSADWSKIMKRQIP